MKKVKLFEVFNQSYTGKQVWQHIVNITPDEEQLPTGFKSTIMKHKFQLEPFDISQLLKTDPDFKEYYISGEERYEEDEVNPMDILEPIVVVKSELLDGYSRVAQLLRSGIKETEAYVAK